MVKLIMTDIDGTLIPDGTMDINPEYFEVIEKLVEKADNFDGDIFDLGMMYRYEVFEQMNTLREDADKLETIVDEDFWPLPTYGDMLFNI